MALSLLFLKFSQFLVYIILNLFLFSPDVFKIFRKTVTIYNIKIWSDDTTGGK